MPFRSKFLNPKAAPSNVPDSDSFPKSRLLQQRLSLLPPKLEVEVGFFIPPDADASPERVEELIAEENEMRGWDRTSGAEQR